LRNSIVDDRCGCRWCSGRRRGSWRVGCRWSCRWRRCYNGPILGQTQAAGIAAGVAIATGQIGRQRGRQGAGLAGAGVGAIRFIKIIVVARFQPHQKKQQQASGKSDCQHFYCLWWQKWRACVRGGVGCGHSCILACARRNTAIGDLLRR